MGQGRPTARPDNGHRRANKGHGHGMPTDGQHKQRE